MATNLLKAGYKVVVHDLHRQSADHHLQAGAEWADTPRALAEKSDVILTSVVLWEAVRQGVGGRRLTRRTAQHLKGLLRDLMPQESKKNDDRNGNSQQVKQNSTAHYILPLLRLPVGKIRA